MDSPTATEKSTIHSRLEIDNFEVTTRALEKWVHSGWPSSYVIPDLHRELLQGVESYSSKGLLPRNTGENRKEDIRVDGESENFYVRGTDVDPILRNYFEDLDQKLAALPSTAEGNIETIVETASWAYYVFERIHPFLDCNGRTGRLILNRIIMGTGLQSIIFLDNWFEQERENHLNAMNLVDRTGDLAALDLYLLNALKTNTNNKHLETEIDALIAKKSNALLTERQLKGISNIWDKFGNIDIASPAEVAQSYSAP